MKILASAYFTSDAGIPKTVPKQVVHCACLGYPNRPHKRECASSFPFPPHLEKTDADPYSVTLPHRFAVRAFVHTFAMEVPGKDPADAASGKRCPVSCPAAFVRVKNVCMAIEADPHLPCLVPTLETGILHLWEQILSHRFSNGIAAFGREEVMEGGMQRD